MKKIICKIDNKMVEIEVSDEVAVTYQKMVAEEKREQWRASKHKDSSLDALCDAGFQIEDPRVNIEEDFLRKERCHEVRSAIKQLLPDQQELIIRIFFQGKSQIQVAKEHGIEKTTLHNRLDRAIKKLKKILSKTVYFGRSHSFISEGFASQVSQEVSDE